MIYLLCYAISILLAYTAKHTKNRSDFIVISILSISVTALLAGMRDLSIGTDTINYYTHPLYWDGAVNSAGLIDYLKHFAATSRTSVPEVVFALLIGVVQKTTGNYNVFLFIVHLVIVGCVYIGAFRLKDHADPVFTLAVFYLLYFGQTLNIYRQYMALAILFAILRDLEERHDKRYLIITAIAFFIHNTAILGIVPLLLYRILYPNNTHKFVPLIKKMALFSIIVIASASLIPVLRILIDMGIIKRNFLWYLNIENRESHALVLLFLMVEAIGILLFLRRYRKLEHSDFFIFCSISFAALTYVGSFIKYGDRLAEYFSLINIISIGMIVKCQQSRENRVIVRGAALFVVLFYWLYVYAINNSSNTMPYLWGIS